MANIDITYLHIFLLFFFFNKVVITQRSRFSFVFRNLVVILVRRMVVVFLVRLVVVSSWYDVCLSSLWWNVYLCDDDSEEQSFSDQRQKIKSMVVNMLKN